MIKKSFKKSLLTTASVFAIGAFDASGAFAAVQTTGGSVDMTADGIAEGVLWDGVHTLTVTAAQTSIGNTGGLSLDSGATDRGTLLLNNTGALAITGAIGQTGAGEQLTLITVNTTAVTSVAGDIFVEAINFAADGTIALASGKTFTDGAIASGVITSSLASTTVGQGTFTLSGGTQAVKGQIGTTTNYIKTVNAGVASAATTFTADVYAVTTNVTGTGTITLNTSLFGTSLSYDGNGTVVIATDGESITAAITNDTGTDSQGTLSITDAGTINGAIGASGASLLKINLTTSNASKTVAFVGDVFATTLQFGTHAAGTATFTDGSDVTGAFVSGGDNLGVITFAGTSTVTGTIGSSTSIDFNILNVGANSKTVTISGDTYAVKTNITGSGTLALQADITGAIDFDADGFLTLADGSDVTGVILAAAADDNGTITTAGASTLTGILGAAAGGNALKKFTLNGADKTVATSGGIHAASIYFDADGTLTVADNDAVNTGTITTGHITTETKNTGTVNFLGTTTFGSGDDDIGTSALPLKAVKITGAADTVTITGNLYAQSVVIGDSASDVAVISIGAGKTLSAAVTTFATGDGTLTFAGAGTMTGQIGTSSAELLLVTVGNGAVTADSDVYATSVNFAGDNVFTVAAGKSITSSAASGTAMVTTGTDDEGTLTFSGSTTVADDVGTAALQLNVINFSAGTATVSEDLNADTINVLGSTRLEFTGTAKTHTGDLISAGSSTVDVNGNAVSIATGDADTGLFTLSGNGTFAVTVTGGDTNDSGSLTAVGVADLSSGNLTVAVTGSEYIAAGTTYAVVTAGTLNNDEVTITDDSYTVSFTGDGAANVTAGTLTLTAVRTNTLQSSSTLVNESAVGTALEGIAATGNPDLDAIQGALQNLSSAVAVEAALATLDPDASGMTSQASSAASDAALGTVSNRIETALGVTSGVAAGGMSANSGLWGQVFGTSADQDYRKGVRGYQADVVGGTIGADTLISDQARVGGSLSYAKTDADSANGTAEIDSIQVAAYGSYDYNGKWYSDALLAFANHSYDAKRNVVVGAISNQAKGDFDGQQYTIKVGGGYRMDVEGGLKVTPKASLRYSLLTQDNYTETGSTANLVVDSDDQALFESSLGVSLSYPIVDGQVTYIPELRAAWEYDFIGDEQEMSSRFSSVTTNAFTTKGADIAQSTLKLGVGLDVLAQDNVTVSFDYDYESKANYAAHTGALKARFAF